MLNSLLNIPTQVAAATTSRRRLFYMSLGALGVVYGDIGTSPLYALRESLMGLPLTPENIYGVLSLIFWSLIIVVSCKYLILILRADNDGEGGILALSALLRQHMPKAATTLLIVITIVGASLTIGDGMLTPAISVLSAVEGLSLLSPGLTQWVIPLTLAILVLLFWVQKRGTGHIGTLFGPVILVWFFVIGFLGFIHIFEAPRILTAINPVHAYALFALHKMETFKILGSVFLVMTGGEALYADIGHFGKTPIRYAWFTIVLPALILNYFGQGAHLLVSHPSTATAAFNPFYQLAPSWFLPPFIVLATFATIIASQAMITAVFSIVKQAVLLNLLPRVRIVQTSAEEKGQVYVPLLNLILAIGTCVLVLIFHSSSSLAHAYGIAVNLIMLITTVLTMYLALRVWRWHWSAVLLVFPILLLLDLSYLAGNLHKFAEGAWVPLLIASVSLGIMYTWNQGFERLKKLNFKDRILARNIMEDLNNKRIRRLPGTALFITHPYDQGGGSLLHHLKINHILARNVIFLSVLIENKPYVPLVNKFQIEQKAEGFYQLNIYFGFAENIDLPEQLNLLDYQQILPFKLEPLEMSFFIQMISVDIHDDGSHDMFNWQKILFAMMLRNALTDIQFYKLPYNRTVAIGTYCQL